MVAARSPETVTSYKPHHNTDDILRVSENRVFRKLEPTRERVTGSWKTKKKKKEFPNLYAAPNVRVTKSRWVRWAEHVAGMKYTRGYPKVS
jgi:hypothetical protein